MHPKDLLFGQLAVNLKLLSNVQLKQVIAVQRQHHPRLRFGAICQHLGFMNADHVQQVLDHQTKILRSRPDARSPGYEALTSRVDSREDSQSDWAEPITPTPSRDSTWSNSASTAKATVSSEDGSHEVHSVDGTDASPRPRPITAQGPTQEQPAIDALLERAVRLGAKELHLASNCTPLVRLDGTLVNLYPEPSSLSSSHLRTLLLDILPLQLRERFESHHDADFTYSPTGLGRFRANYFLDRRGVGAVFRAEPRALISASEMGWPAEVLSLCQLASGLVLVASPPRGGKSTTLASLVDFINSTRACRILCIERPIEYVHENRKSLITQREVGLHTPTFYGALQAALREGPDVVVVDELADEQAVKTVLELVMMGRLVFATITATTASEAIARLIVLADSPGHSSRRTQVADALRGIIAQVLCPTLTRGHVAAHEVIISRPSTADVILHTSPDEIASRFEATPEHRVQSMNECLLGLVRNQVVGAHQARTVSPNKTDLSRLFVREGVRVPTDDEAAA